MLPSMLSLTTLAGWLAAVHDQLRDAFPSLFPPITPRQFMVDKTFQARKEPIMTLETSNGLTSALMVVETSNDMLMKSNRTWKGGCPAAIKRGGPGCCGGPSCGRGG